ncbi:MAG: S-layer homology domain-containing protein [Clostridia bacterium]|nr:S-layer homology domain-containing protein [Clostridia bacterium]
MMKKITAMIFILVLIFALMPRMPVFAHGAVFEQKMIGENTLRVTVKWSSPSDGRGIAIRSYAVEGGKTLRIGYEVVSGRASTDSKDFDTRNFLPPVRILLFNTADMNSTVFTDVKDHFAEAYIQNLHDAGIVNGRPDGSFGPNNPVSRAEFMTMMVKALKLEGSADNPKGYRDIDGHWAKNTLLIASKNNLISGYPDKTIKPDNPITLAEVSAVISRAFNFKTVNNGDYSKLRTGVWYTPYLKKMFDSGVLSVNDPLYQNQFDEEAKLSRGNCAMMISRALSTY